MRATTSSRTPHPSAPPGVLRELSRLRAENQRLTRRTVALEAQCTRLESLAARYKELWHGAFEGVVIHDKGVVIDANPAYAKLFGLTVAEMLGSSVYDHLDPRVHRPARARIRRNATYRAQIIGKHKDGSLIPMEYHARPIEVDGRKVRIVAVRDISHLVQQQEALAASEERFRNLVEGSIQGILVHRAGKPLFANRALARMFGYSSAGAVSRLPSVKALMTPKAWDFVYGHESRRARGLRAPDRYEFEGRHKKGHALWLDSSSRVVMWDGKPAIQSTWIDITERRRRESDRIAHERLLQTVMDTIPHSVFVKDAQGRYLMVNQAMATMWRRSPHAFIGRTSSQVGVFSEPLLRDIQRWDRHVLRTGKPQPPTEISIPTATQDRRFDMVRYPVRDNTGRVTGLVALSQNVTERRRAEQALRESELRFRTLVEVSIQGIAVYRGRRAVFSNAAYARLAGYASP
ncbi:MAG TPA: PAS domain S-box protein, partial [bacterium]